MDFRLSRLICKKNGGRWNGRIRILHIMLLLPLIHPPLAAQPDSVYSDYIQFPAPIAPGSFRPSIGASITVLPQILVEDELRQTPLLQGQLRYGLPLNFSLTGILSTNVLTNLIELEGRWDLQVNRFAFGLSYSSGWWYGFAPIENFNITATSGVHSPGVSGGLRIRDFYVSARVEAQMVSLLRIESDGTQTNMDENFIAGYALEMNLEQPFWGETDVALGLRFNYSRSLYQSWLAFNAFDEKLIYPEFTAHLLF